MTYFRESLQDILDNIQRSAWLRYEDDVVGLLDEFPRDCNLVRQTQGIALGALCRVAA